ncbi:hypothetical protein GCM10027269_57750 [Kribbella endophytica]
MFRVPRASCSTSPTRLNTFKCCEIAGRLTGTRPANAPTELGPPRRKVSKITRRVGSPNASNTGEAASNTP